MKNISTHEDLSKAIILLENKQQVFVSELKSGIGKALQGFDGVSQIQNTGAMKSLLVSAIIKISTEWISRKMSSVDSSGTIKKMSGIFLQINDPKINMYTENEV